MKLGEYLNKQFKKHNININLYFKIQNIELLKYVYQKEQLEKKGIDKKSFFKKYIKPEEYIYFKNEIENNYYIEDVLNKIFPENDKKINQWKKCVIDNFNNELDNNYYIYFKYILNIFKNKTDIILDRSNMDFKLSPEQFEQVYSKVFMPHYNEENKDKMKQKKFRLKQKLCKGCVNKEHLDYQIILFQFILNNHI